MAVEDILQWMASGRSQEKILEDFPSLTEEHLRAALSFAAKREAIIKTVVS